MILKLRIGKLKIKNRKVENHESESTKGDLRDLKDNTLSWSDIVAKEDRIVVGEEPPREDGDSGKAELGKSSWSSVVAKKENLVKYEFETKEIDGRRVVPIPDEMLEEAPLWEDILIGKFLSKSPPIGRIYSLVNRIWPLDDKSVKIEVFPVDETTVKFRINKVGTRERVLKRRIWHMFGVPVILSKWCPVEEEDAPVVQKMPIWVMIKNVPRRVFSWKGLSFLSSPVGTPKRLHPETRVCKSFDVAKIFVEVDINAKLPTSCDFTSKRGEVYAVEYVYPWLPTRCSKCDKWGHEVANCFLHKKEQKAKAVSDKKNDTLEEGEIPEAVIETTPEVVNEVVADVTPEVVAEVVVEVEEKHPTPVDSPLVMRVIEGKVSPQTGNEAMGSHSEVSEWQPVSSSRMAKQRSPVEELVTVSPSSFALLSVESEDGLQEEDDVHSDTDTYINQDMGVNEMHVSNSRTKKEKSKAKKEISSRPHYPRQARGVNRFLQGTFVLNKGGVGSSKNH